MHTPSRRVPYRTWPGALGVALAIGAYVGGLALWDHHTPGSRPLNAGQTLTVGPARFVPAPGWQMDLARSKASNTLMLFKGSHKFQVTTAAWEGGPNGPMARQLRLMERGQGLRIEGEVSDFINGWGMQGVTFAYYGPKLAGRLWQVVDLRRKAVVRVDFYGGNDGLSDALTDARAMVDSMDLGAPL